MEILRLQWLMPILQHRIVLNEMKKCDTLLLNRYNFPEFHLVRTNIVIHRIFKLIPFFYVEDWSADNTE